MGVYCCGDGVFGEIGLVVVFWYGCVELIVYLGVEEFVLDGCLVGFDVVQFWRMVGGEQEQWNVGVECFYYGGQQIGDGCV